MKKHEFRPYWAVIREGSGLLYNQTYITEAIASTAAEELCMEKGLDHYVVRVVPIKYCRKVESPIFWESLE